MPAATASAPPAATAPLVPAACHWSAVARSCGGFVGNGDRVGGRLARCRRGRHGQSPDAT